MSRMARVKEALTKTVEEMKREGIRNAYQAGFCNGVIMSSHYLNMTDGKPPYVEIPFPATESPEPHRSEAEIEYELHRDGVIQAAKALYEARVSVAWKEGDTSEEVARARAAIQNLVAQIETLHAFEVGQEKGEDACNSKSSV